MLLSLVLVAAAGPACGGEHDAGTSGSTSSGSESSSGTSSMTAPTVTTDLTSSTTAPSSESSSTAADSSSSSESGTIPDACAPEPDDDACAMCTKSMCCDALVVCFDAPDCTCFANCYDAMGFMSDEMCRMECMLDANPDPWADVYNCSAMNCLGDCI
jgi:hypothetical protein